MTPTWKCCIAGLYVVVLTIAGCRSTPRPQPDIMMRDDEAAMEDEILRHLPAGTPIEEAERFMAANGFKCSREVDSQDGAPYLFCDIQRPTTWPVSRRWMITMKYDEEKVTSVRVKTGLIGP